MSMFVIWHGDIRIPALPERRHDGILDTTAFLWDGLVDLKDYASTSETILEAWKNNFSFNFEDEDHDLPDLRTPHEHLERWQKITTQCALKFSPAEKEHLGWPALECGINIK